MAKNGEAIEIITPNEEVGHRLETLVKDLENIRDDHYRFLGSELADINLLIEKVRRRAEAYLAPAKARNRM